MATFHLEDGCTLVVGARDASEMSRASSRMCADRGIHDFSERRQVFDKHGNLADEGGGVPLDKKGGSLYLYDLCSKCGARLYPPGGFKAAKNDEVDTP